MIRLLADVNAVGHFEYLAALMQGAEWIDFWNDLELKLLTFDDIDLPPDANDLEVWQRCQAEELVLLTDNRNHESPDSLQAAILTLNTPDSIPVFTISDLKQFRARREYADRVVERFYEYLMELDRYRGTGRLFLP